MEQFTPASECRQQAGIESFRRACQQAAPRPIEQNCRQR